MIDIEELVQQGTTSKATLGIQQWIQAEAARAKQLMKSSEWILETDDLSELSRTVMKNSYVGTFWRDIKKTENALL